MLADMPSHDGGLCIQADVSRPLIPDSTIGGCWPGAACHVVERHHRTETKLNAGWVGASHMRGAIFLTLVEFFEQAKSKQKSFRGACGT